MVFILRSERAPSRVLRERDGTVERVFWVWRDGSWAVATALLDGTIQAASSDECDLAFHAAGGVTIVKVRHAPPRPTIPAPAPSSEAASGVLAKANPADDDDGLEVVVSSSRRSVG